MRMVRVAMIALVVTVGGIMLSVDKMHAYSYGAWVGMTGANTVAVNPFLSGSLDGTSYTDWDMLLEWGFSDKVDMFYSFGGQWGMVRYDFSGDNLAIGALYLASDACGLQYHMIYDKLDKFAFEANVAITMPYGAMLDSMSIGAIIAPTLKLGAVNIYVEVDPAYTLGSSGGFTLGLVPGICFNIGDAQLSIGVPLGDLASGSISPSYGAWLWIPFSYAAKEK